LAVVAAAVQTAETVAAAVNFATQTRLHPGYLRQVLPFLFKSVVVVVLDLQELHQLWLGEEQLDIKQILEQAAVVGRARQFQRVEQMVQVEPVRMAKVQQHLRLKILAWGQSAQRNDQFLVIGLAVDGF
jgi:hypothetical protein